MNEILKIVLSLSLSGSLLILGLLLFKPLFRNRISKRWQYYIWLVVIARLLLPFTPETSPVGTLFQQVDRAIVQMDTTPGQNIAPAPQLGDDTAIKNDTTPKNGVTDAAPTPLRLFTIIIQNIWLAWLVAALILVIRKITIYQSFVKYIKAGRAEVSDTAILDRLALIGEQVGIKRPVELYTNSLISSPLLLGFFRPCIVLPSTDLAPVDLEYTLLHELTHYKRWDMFYKWLVQLVICLHWFNPLVYVMGREVSRACELACDEIVIKALDPQGRRAYGDTLLNARGAGGKYKDTLSSVTLNENKHLLKERLGAIMAYHEKTKLVVAISLVLTITLACGATAIGAYATPTSQSSATVTPISSKVVHEGGIYYIFCDGSDESDKPSSGVTEGSIMFVLVRKDGYTSIGPFDDITRLNDDVMKQCEYMLKAQSITQEETNLVMEVATNIQLGNEKQYEQVPLEDDEYSKWKIDKKDGTYYYDNERVRIFMDLREDNSFVNFNFDELGTIDIRLMRGHNGNITKIEYLSQTEAEEILTDYVVVENGYQYFSR